MDNDLYITQLPGHTTPEDLSKFLEKKLNSNCSVSVKNGRIQGTCIAFCSVGGYDVDDAISVLNYAEFKGCKMKVMRYKLSDRNKKYRVEDGQNREVKQSGAVDNQQPSTPKSNGIGASFTAHTGVLVHIDSAEEFYVQVQADCQFLQLITSTLTLYDYDRTADVAAKPVVGEMYAARYNLDGKHYRAVLLSEIKNSKAEVRFVDFGNKETVDAASLKKIEKDIAGIEYVAKRCRFHGLKILDLQGATQTLEAAGDQFRIHQYSETKMEDRFKLWEVDLFDAKDRSLREQMIEKGLLELCPRTPDYKKRTPEIDGSGDHAKTYSPSVELSGETFSPPSSCLITHVESATCFYIQGAYGKQDLSAIYDSLQNVDEFPIVEPSNAVPHKIYAAKFSQDNKWYRCTIKSSIATFVDFGNNETLTGKLKKLPDDIASIKFQAIKCHLGSVKIINADTVKAELMRYGTTETALKCHIQKALGDSPASVDFGVENQFRSFCSWLIEHRLAERLYNRSPQTQSPARPPQMIPPQVLKRNAIRNVQQENVKPSSKQNHVRKPRASYPRQSPTKKDNSRASFNHNDHLNGEKAHAVVEVIDEGIVREKVLSELTEMIENTFESRMKIIRWRSILGVPNSNGETSKSLFNRLDLLQAMESESETDDETVAAVHRQLISLRKKVMENQTAFYAILSDLNDKLVDEDVDEAEVLQIAEQRDHLAEELVQNVESFITALSSNTDAVQKRISEIKETSYDIDFLLSMCPKVDESETDENMERDGRSIWEKFSESEELRQLMCATDQASSKMDTCRVAFGFLTGVLGLEAAKHGSHNVKTFFPMLDSLNSAMKKELNCYRTTFVVGSNGKLTAACLSRYDKFTSGQIQELNNLETEKYAMTEYNHKASEILSARSALNEETIQSIESSAQDMKKYRSKLRHNLADLEDLVENESEESDEIAKMKASIDKIRLKLHSILKDVTSQKEFITHALSMRPELSTQLVKLLKSAGPSICDSESVASWETSYFSLKPLNPEKTLYSSRFGDDDVIISKILVTDDGHKLRNQVKLYQEAVSSADQCLLPILAAFAPPKESHVLYIMCPSYELCPSPTDVVEFLKCVQSLMLGQKSLRKAGLNCISNAPMNHLARIVGKNQYLLKPSAFLEASDTCDLQHLVRQMKQVAVNAKFDRILYEEAFDDVSDVDMIINSVSKLLKEYMAKESQAQAEVEIEVAPEEKEGEPSNTSEIEDVNISESQSAAIASGDNVGRSDDVENQDE